jgi:hypothetical protein
MNNDIKYNPHQVKPIGVLVARIGLGNMPHTFIMSHAINRNEQPTFQVVNAYQGNEDFAVLLERMKQFLRSPGFDHIPKCDDVICCIDVTNDEDSTETYCNYDDVVRLITGTARVDRHKIPFGDPIPVGRLQILNAVDKYMGNIAPAFNFPLVAEVVAAITVVRPRPPTVEVDEMAMLTKTVEDDLALTASLAVWYFATITEFINRKNFYSSEAIDYRHIDRTII